MILPASTYCRKMTAMIIQWVAPAAGGVAALPSWALTGVRAQIAWRPLGKKGLWADLYALRRAADHGAAHLDAFVTVVRQQSFRALEGIKPIPTPRSSATDKPKR